LFLDFAVSEVSSLWVALCSAAADFNRYLLREIYILNKHTWDVKLYHYMAMKYPLNPYPE
jgi:hypothetical protein